MLSTPSPARSTGNLTGFPHLTSNLQPLTSALNPLESAFALCDGLSPLECAFTPTPGVGGSPSHTFLKFHLNFSGAFSLPTSNLQPLTSAFSHSCALFSRNPFVCHSYALFRGGWGMLSSPIAAKSRAINARLRPSLKFYSSLFLPPRRFDPAKGLSISSSTDHGARHTDHATMRRRFATTHRRHLPLHSLTSFTSFGVR